MAIISVFENNTVMCLYSGIRTSINLCVACKYSGGRINYRRTICHVRQRNQDLDQAISEQAISELEKTNQEKTKAEAERLEELRLKYTTRDPKDHLMRCVAVCPELEGRAARCEVPQSKLKNDSFTCPCGNVPIFTDIED